MKFNLMLELLNFSSFSPLSNASHVEQQKKRHKEEVERVALTRNIFMLLILCVRRDGWQTGRRARNGGESSHTTNSSSLIRR